MLHLFSDLFRPQPLVGVVRPAQDAVDGEGGIVNEAGGAASRDNLQNGIMNYTQ